MAVKKVKKEKVKVATFDMPSLPAAPKVPKGGLGLLLEDDIPVVQRWGVAVESKYPQEFSMIDGMKVGQSIAFITKDKAAMVNGIRNRIQKLGKKRFVVKKVDHMHSRMWRVEDGTKINFGGRIKGVSPYSRKDPSKNKGGANYVKPGPKVGFRNKAGVNNIPAVATDS